MSDFSVRSYQSPGPVASAYLMDRTNTVRFMMGPFGSGKTNVNFFDKLKCAMEMPKCTRGGPERVGNRYYRHVELRDTYQNLWGTTIKSWNVGWFSKEVGKWSGGDGRRATHELIFDMPDGGKLYFEIIFQAMQDQDIESALRGIEPTSVNLGEADLMAGDILTYASGRVLQQRYPRKDWFDEGQQYYTSVTGDLNPPDVDSWIYNIFEEIRPEGHKIFKQPSGRGPLGENRSAIGREIYERMARENAHRPWWVRRMVDGQYGFSREGEPVYPEYDDATHCAESALQPLAGLKLRLSFDQGIRGPAMLVKQWTPSGQLRVLNEYIPGRIGPTGFGMGCKRMLESEYRGFAIERAAGDPAGFSGGDTENGDKSMFQTVEGIIGAPIFPAESQELDIRQDGVRQLLRHRIDGKTPAILISPVCKMLRKGFNSHYRYKKRRGSEVGTDPTPEKNEFSNPHDALQYGVMDLMGIEGVKRGLLMGGRGDRIYQDGDEDDAAHGTVFVKTDFDVMAS
jgi:hypothetical protein